MTADVRQEVIDITTLDEASRARLIDELFALNGQLFAGVSREDFIQEVITIPARWTRIQLLRTAAGELVGYCAVHLFDRVLEGRCRRQG